ncbi:MAG: hypothetical protein EP343_26465 [Deltaproteobacteria bacterium]|nr:MAG: hypothetical protein EP343_26465 [Deltaproteobacteria bacterium]
MRVHLLREPQPDDFRLLKSLVPGHVEWTAGPILAQSADFSILVAGFPSQEDLAASPNLTTLVIPWAGLPEPTRIYLQQHPDLVVHNIHHNASSVAESAITLLLAVAKETLPFDAKMRNHDWGSRYDNDNQSLLLDGKQALVLGYGAIGKRIARLCHAFGMTVHSTRRSQQESVQIEEGKWIHPTSKLHELLPETQVLIISVPLTDETRGMIGSQELAKLPSNAVLVNIGRGAIVDEEALFLALKEKHIFGAGLDVWYNYPKDIPARKYTPPSKYPFHTLDNVVMSPHRADHCDDTGRLRMIHLAEVLKAAALGEELPNPVNLDVGY